MSRKFIFGGSYASFVGLLDLYPAEVAYSLRKLSSSYTGAAIRVRRNSDQAEQDIGFSGGILDVTSLASFVGANIGFISKVYNQGMGGGTYDATQSVLVSQPLIYYSNNVFITNTKASIDFHRSVIATTPVPPMTIASAFNYKTAFSVGRVQQQNTINYILGNESPANGLFYNGSLAGVNGLGGFDSTNLRSITGEDLNQHLGYFNMRSSRLYIAKDGGSETDSGVFALSLTSNLLGGRSSSLAIHLRGDIQEIILFSTDQSANKSAIESNINSYYAIYP